MIDPGGAADAGRPPVEARSVLRAEDARLLRGAGAFTDDLVLPDALHAAFVRSPHAHALLGDVDVSGAAAVPGVVAAFSGRDLAEGGVSPIPTTWFLDGMHPGERRALAIDRVRFEGEPLAVLIAETPEAARAAVDLVVADFDPLPCVTDVRAAAARGAPTVYDDAPGNICFEWAIGDGAATDDAFAGAHLVISATLRNNRLIPNALEPRSCAAVWSAGELTLHVTSGNPHLHRLVLAGSVLTIPEHRLRVVCGDLGGAFGSRVVVYPEEVAVAWAARKLDGAVRWTATRHEAFATDSHARDHSTEAAIAFDTDGRITALRVRTLANLGANLSLHAAAGPTWRYAAALSGPYAIPAIHCAVTGVFSHTCPVDSCGGAASPEATYVLERLMDAAARALGEDPAAVRRRNLIRRDRMPYRTAVDTVYDNGDYTALLERALERAGYDALRDEQRRLRRQGRHVGIGVACHVAGSGPDSSGDGTLAGSRVGSWESARVQVHPTGRVTVEAGSPDAVQGHETTYAQVAAAVLGVDVADVAVRRGDTEASPFGAGTLGVRGGPAGGAAVWHAAGRVAAKARVVAARLLGVEESAVDRTGGRYVVRGKSEEGRTFQEVALAAYTGWGSVGGSERGLEATAYFDSPGWTWAAGTHVAVVDVDSETGVVTLRRYVGVDDCGNVVNPAIEEGQLVGGIVQGVGQALWEGAEYDGSGRLVTRSLRSYAVARTSRVPSFELERVVTASTSNPLGVKGVGGAGAVASSAAVANAVLDALSEFGVSELDMPFTPEKVWLAMRSGRLRERGGGGA